MHVVLSVAVIVMSIVAVATPSASAAVTSDVPLVYSQQHSIWRVMPDGSQRHRLASVNAADLHWSPNHSQLAFTNTSLHRIETVRADGSGRTMVAPQLPCAQSQPVWSPDGSAIAFACQHNGSSNLYITRNGLITALTPIQRGITYRSPAWSTSGASIAYERRIGNNATLVVQNVAQRTSRTVTSFSDIVAERHISWSFDDHKILYNDTNNELYTIHPDGENRSTLSDGDSYDGTWSHSNRIIFIEDPQEQSLTISQPDGSLTYLSLVGGPGGANKTPHWSPDGTRAAVIINGPEGGLATVDTTTGSVAMVARGVIASVDW